MSETKVSEDIQKKLELLRSWVNKQPHLPKDLEDRILIRFMHSCYYDIEKTKKCMELFFTIRTSSPELLNNRDPLSDPIQRALNIINLAVIPISGNRNLWAWQLNDPGLDRYDYLLDAKSFFLASDAWLLDDDRLEESDIVVLDVKDISLKFITKFSVSIARKLAKYQEDAMPIRLKQIHAINAPPFIDKLYALMKPFMKQENYDMIHFHPPNTETLYKYIDRDELPNDFGGKAGKMDDLMKKTMDLILSKREYFLNNNFWKLLDTKRPKDSKIAEEIASGSFRSLAID